MSGATADSVALPRGARGARTVAAEARADDWPHTTRLMPWLVAGFVGMLWLIPFDSIELSSVPAPVDPKLDRIVLLGIGLAWLAAYGAREQLKFRRSAMNWAVLAFIGVAIAGIAANESTLVIQSELTLAIKKLALLFSFAALFFLITSTVRPSEVHNYVLLMLGLACITAFGVIIEYKFNYNIFYRWSEQLFRAPFYVNPEPPDIPFDRRSITGPTLHGIAVATMLAMALPLAVVGMLRPRGSKRWCYLGAVALLLIGALSTQRKTGLVVPAAAFLTLALYRPRQMARILPFGAVVIVAVFVLAHGAAVGVKAQFVGPNLENAS